MLEGLKTEFAILAWDPKYAEVFRDLNLAWIEEYFEVEETDRRVLFHPQREIIDRGGAIFIGLLNGDPAGVCALQKEDEDGVYELAKMAVDAKLRGRGLGRVLLGAVIEKARAMGIRKLTILSNRRLASALHLYHEAGFREVPPRPTDYARADIELALDLE